MIDVAALRKFTDTPIRAHNFYCYCTIDLCQDQGIIFLLIESYRKTRRKRQAVFINDWFINGNIPDDLQASGFLGKANIGQKEAQAINALTTDTVKALGQTFADKAKNQGGGLGGFFGALMQKTGDNKPPETLFDVALDGVVRMLGDRSHGFEANGPGIPAKFQRDSVYQPRATFANPLIQFRQHLKTAGFEPDKLGLY